MFLFCAKIAALGAFLIVFCHCKTTEPEVVRTKSTSFTFAGQEGEVDPKKYTMSGFEKDEKGNWVAKKGDMYRETAKGFDGSFKTKEAKFRKTDANTKEFRTPEYLKMQEYAGVKSAREGGSLAREANFDGSRTGDRGKIFQRKTDNSSALASYDTGEFAQRNRVYETGANREGSRAIQNSANATGVRQSSGYTANTKLSMDDVKKMVNPGSFSR